MRLSAAGIGYALIVAKFGRCASLMPIDDLRGRPNLKHLVLTLKNEPGLGSEARSNGRVMDVVDWIRSCFTRLRNRTLSYPHLDRWGYVLQPEISRVWHSVWLIATKVLNTISSVEKGKGKADVMRGNTE